MTNVIVIGAGVIGTSTAYYLAKRGAQVRLIDQFQIGHTLGSSHGPSRIIRLAYETTDYVVLAQTAFERWHELNPKPGNRCLYAWVAWILARRMRTASQRLARTTLRSELPTMRSMPPKFAIATHSSIP